MSLFSHLANHDCEIQRVRIHRGPRRAAIAVTSPAAICATALARMAAAADAHGAATAL